MMIRVNKMLKMIDKSSLFKRVPTDETPSVVMFLHHATLSCETGNEAMEAQTQKFQPQMFSNNY